MCTIKGSTIEAIRIVDERTAMVGLLLRAQSKWRTVTEAVLDAGSARAVLEATAHGQQTALFPTADEPADELSAARSLIAACEARGAGVHSFLDDTYPAQLRQIHEMPPVVFSRGRLEPDQRAIAVVGSRKATERGLEIAARIAEHLAGRNVTVVSGLAAGIDTAAHTAALRANGRTVAVIGTGINRTYPRQNAELQETIAERGLVLSQFLPDAPPTKHSFPMRNAVMSGYAAATVVVEAGEHSGARIQARYALQHGRPVIFPRELLANEWARRYADRPGVYVVASLSELVSRVEDLLEEATITAEELLKAVGSAW